MPRRRAGRQKRVVSLDDAKHCRQRRCRVERARQREKEEGGGGGRGRAAPHTGYSVPAPRRHRIWPGEEASSLRRALGPVRRRGSMRSRRPSDTVLGGEGGVVVPWSEERRGLDPPGSRRRRKRGRPRSWGRAPRSPPRCAHRALCPRETEEGVGAGPTGYPARKGEELA